MSRPFGLGRRRSAVLLVPIVLSVVCLSSAVPSAQARGCGSVYAGSPRLFGDVKAQVRVIRGRVSCASARRVARAFFNRKGTYVDNGYGYNSYWAIRGGWRGDGGMDYWTFRNRKRGARVGGNFRILGSGAVAKSPGDAQARTAEVHDCHHWAFYPNVIISSARNMSCRVARGEMRRYKGAIRYRFTTPYRRFRCKRVSGMELGGQWRCTRGRRAFRFDFGD